MKNRKKIVLILLFFLAHSIIYAQYKEFTFAWITDTHIGYAPATNDLKAVIEDINKRDDISFVILSGDVTEKGKSKELIEAKNLLSKLNVSCFVLPGNHDYKWSESGCSEFFNQFNDDKFAFKFHDYLFLGMNSAYPMRGVMGHFASHDIKWLNTFLNSIKDDNLPIIFFTHFPIDKYNIDNYYSGLTLLCNKNVRFIGAGHGHENKKMDFDGLSGIMARSILSRGAKAGYMLVKVSKESILFNEKRVGTDSLFWADSIPLRLKPVYKPANGNSNEWKYFDNKRAEILWTDSLNYISAASPALSGDRVILCDMLGRINCYDVNDGKKVWEYQLDNSIVSTPAIKDGKALVISVDGRVYYFDIESGKIKWQTKFNYNITGTPEIKGDTAYFGTGEYGFTAIGLNSGTELWSFKNSSAHVESKPLISGGKIYFTAWDGYLYALERSSGKMLWKWSEEKPNFYYAPAACNPVLIDGKILLTAPNKFITLISSDSGKTIWRSNQHPSWESIGISVTGDRFYVKGLTDTLFCYELKNDTPELLWYNVLGYGFETSPIPIIEHGGSVYVPAGNGFLYTVDAKTGKFKRSYFLGESIMNSPLILEDGTIIVSNMDGVIRRIRYK